MPYLTHFTFPDRDREFDYMLNVKRQCYTDFYPFQVLSSIDMTELSFGPVTILHGGNGSGKTTALNVIAEGIGADRDSAFNRSAFFPDYVKLCGQGWGEDRPRDCRIITSDDVFDYMLNLRCLNEGIDRKREEIFEEYLNRKHSRFRLNSLEDYEELALSNRAKSRTQSRYVRESLMANAVERSNGESAYLYFVNKIREDGLYLLDEPENSLAPARQRELVKFIEESVRFFRCQFIIATHSPFLLALREARIYDLSETPVTEKSWTQLENVRQYRSFFMEHEAEFTGEAGSGGGIYG